MTTRDKDGKAFGVTAAFLPVEMTKSLIAQELRQYRQEGEDDATQQQHLQDELSETRQRGIAQAARPQPSSLHQLTVNAFSAPILDSEGQIIMALSITSPASRLSADSDGEIPKTLKAMTDGLSSRLHPQGGVA